MFKLNKKTYSADFTNIVRMRKPLKLLSFLVEFLINHDHKNAGNPKNVIAFQNKKQ